VLYEYDDHNNKNAVILERNVPINAHPPRHRSDLSVVEFLDAVFGLTDENVASYVQQQQEEEEDDNGVSHHTRLPVNIKLDMKELQVVQPAMELLLEKYPHMLNTVPSANTTDTDSDSEAQDENENDKADDNNPTSNLQYIYLNADVMPGPGHRFDPPTIDGDAFLSTCTDVLRANPRPNAELVREVSFFSLGWHVSYLSAGFSTDNAYTNADVQNMVDLIRRYNLDGNGGTADADDNSGGIVLAVNARLLYNDCTPFDAFLDSIPTAQLLVWTGTGELPIPQDRIDSIQAHFQSQGTLDRIGFDCKIATTQLGAIWYGGRVAIKQVYFHSIDWMGHHVLVQVLFMCLCLILCLILQQQQHCKNVNWGRNTICRISKRVGSFFYCGFVVVSKSQQYQTLPSVVDVDVDGDAC